MHELQVSENYPDDQQPDHGDRGGDLDEGAVDPRRVDVGGCQRPARQRFALSQFDLAGAFTSTAGLLRVWLSTFSTNTVATVDAVRTMSGRAQAVRRSAVNRRAARMLDGVASNWVCARRRRR